MIRTLSNWWRKENGAVAPFLALLLIPILGMFALGGEVSNWYRLQREMQNVADSAALAAASNADTTTANKVGGLFSYQKEAYGVAGTYGFVSSTSPSTDTSVTVANVDCPDGTVLGCFKATISRKYPLYLVQMLGYQGNTAISNGRMAVTIAAAATATKRVHYNFCLIGLGTGGNLPPNKTTLQGNVNTELNGNSSGFSECAAESAGKIKCTAVTFKYVLAGSQQGNGCDNFSTSSAQVVDPISLRTPSIASKISDQLTATPNCLTSWPSIITTSVRVCSTTPAMTGDVTISQAPNSDPPVILVYNATIHTGGHTISTAANSSGTFVFTGTGTLPDWFDGDGTVNIQGASGGSFDDFSLISDPSLPSAPFIPGPGSHVTMNAVGIFYAPNTNVNISGSMSSTVGGRSCISLIVSSLYVNGGSLTNNPHDCSFLGYSQPDVVLNRQTLVG